MTNKLKSIWDGFNPPSWLPNWWYYDEYPDYEETSESPDSKRVVKKQFAWEFLRRNPEYQKDYATISDLCEAEGVKDRYQKSLGFNIFPSITDDMPIESMLFHAHLYKILCKWGLAYYLLNPVYGFRETVGLGILGRIGLLNYSEDVVCYQENVIPVDGGLIPTDTEAVYLFDLKLPIIPQLKIAKEQLVERQAKLLNRKKGLKASKAMLGLFHTYLRLLDADAHGADDPAIGRELFPDKNSLTYGNLKGTTYKNIHHRSPRADALRDARKGAYRLMKWGYKLL